MIHRLRSLILFLLAICSIGAAWAQNRSKDSTLTREVLLEQNYAPVVKEATRIYTTPRKEQIVYPKQSIIYKGIELAPYIDPQPYYQPPIHKNDLSLGYNTDLRRGFARLGVGIALNGEWSAGYRIIDAADQSLEISLAGYTQHSFRRVAPLVQDRYFSTVDNDLLVRWNKSFGRFSLTADALYQFGAFNYARYDGLSDYIQSDIDSQWQQHHRAGASFKLGSTTDSPWKWSADAGYMAFNKCLTTDITASPSVLENRIFAQGNVQHQLSEQWRVGGELETNNYFYTTSLQTPSGASPFLSNSILRFTPHARFLNSLFRIDIGLNLIGDLHEQSQVIITPNVEVEYKMSEGYALLLEAKGGVETFDFSTTNRYYRYFDPKLRLSNRLIPINAKLKFVGTPLSALRLEAFGGYKYTSNHFGMGVSSDELGLIRSIVRPLYNGDLQDIYWGVGAEFRPLRDFSLGTSFEMHFFNDRNLAMELPAYRFSLDAKYRIIAPLSVALSYRLSADRKGYNWLTDQVESMPAIHDLTLAVDYKVNKWLGCFLRADNLLFQKYEYLMGIPAQGAILNIGASFLF